MNLVLILRLPRPVSLLEHATSSTNRLSKELSDNATRKGFATRVIIHVVGANMLARLLSGRHCRTGLTSGCMPAMYTMAHLAVTRSHAISYRVACGLQTYGCDKFV